MKHYPFVVIRTHGNRNLFEAVLALLKKFGQEVSAIERVNTNSYALGNIGNYQTDGSGAPVRTSSTAQPTWHQGYYWDGIPSKVAKFDAATQMLELIKFLEEKALKPIHVTVKLNEKYKAIYDGEMVTVGCQTFDPNVIHELSDAIKRADKS